MSEGLQEIDVPLELVIVAGVRDEETRASTYTARVTNNAEVDRHYWLVTEPDEGETSTEEGTLEPGASAEHQITLEFPRSATVRLEFTRSGERVQASASLLGPIAG